MPWHMPWEGGVAEAVMFIGLCHKEGENETPYKYDAPKYRRNGCVINIQTEGGRRLPHTCSSYAKSGTFPAKDNLTPKNIA